MFCCWSFKRNSKQHRALWTLTSDKSARWGFSLVCQPVRGVLKLFIKTNMFPLLKNCLVFHTKYDGIGLPARVGRRRLRQEPQSARVDNTHLSSHRQGRVRARPAAPLSVASSLSPPVIDGGPIPCCNTPNVWHQKWGQVNFLKALQLHLRVFACAQPLRSLKTPFLWCWPQPSSAGSSNPMARDRLPPRQQSNT